MNISVKYVTKNGLRFKNEATNLFAIMARFNALSTPALYIWGSPALRAAVWNSVWSKVFKRRKTRFIWGLNIRKGHGDGNKNVRREEKSIAFL